MKFFHSKIIFLHKEYKILFMKQVAKIEMIELITMKKVGRLSVYNGGFTKWPVILNLALQVGLFVCVCVHVFMCVCIFVYVCDLSFVCVQLKS